MRLTKEFIIDNHIVKFTTKIGDMQLYSCYEYDNILTYYYVDDDGMVIQKIYIDISGSMPRIIFANKIN